MDIAAVPVNHLSDTERRVEVERGIEPLAALLMEVAPGRVVAIKRDIEDPVQRAMGLADIDVPLTTLPFPVRQWRPVYERALAELVRNDTAGRG